jgi:hypothetical protein
MKLYRYISLDRLFSSFKKNEKGWQFKIRFNSPKNYQDPWEGLGNGFVNYLNAVGMEKAYFDLTTEEGYSGGRNKGPRKTFLLLQGNLELDLEKELSEALKFSNDHLTSCWFMVPNNGERPESFAMWDLYAPNCGVLIGYDLNDIELALAKPKIDIISGKVKYEDFLSKTFEKDLHLNVKSLFFKDISYDHEREYRFIIKNRPSEPFCDVLLPPPEEIVANPKLSASSVGNLNHALSEYGMTMTNSKLATTVSRKELIEYLDSQNG